MAKLTAYLAFMCEPPLVGLREHPSYAPQDTIASFDAAGYLDALSAETDLAALQAEVAEDHAARLEAVACGDLSDADEEDVIHKVVIDDDGTIEIYALEGGYLISTITMADVYEAFGMEMPRAAT